MTGSDAVEQSGYLGPFIALIAILALGVGILFLTRVRISRATARADREVHTAGRALVELDDAVRDLDYDLTASGVLQAEDDTLRFRRGRLGAQTVRDSAFEAFTELGSISSPFARARTAVRLRRLWQQSLEETAALRAQHRAWAQANTDIAGQAEAIESELARSREAFGRPETLLAELRERFAPAEFDDIGRAARSAQVAYDDAAQYLDAARKAVQDQQAREERIRDLGAAVRAVREADEQSLIVQLRSRLLLDAARAVPAEFQKANDAVREARGLRERLEPEFAAAFLDALDAARQDIMAARLDIPARPLRAVERLAAVHRSVERTVSAVQSVQQQMQSARAALPGTSATARVLASRAAAAATYPAASAQVRVLAAQTQHALAALRSAADARAAIDLARHTVDLARLTLAAADPAADSPNTRVVPTVSPLIPFAGQADTP